MRDFSRCTLIFPAVAIRNSDATCHNDNRWKCIRLSDASSRIENSAVRCVWKTCQFRIQILVQYVQTNGIRWRFDGRVGHVYTRHEFLVSIYIQLHESMRLALINE